MQKILVCTFFLFLLCFEADVSYAKTFQIDTPLKAAIFYFPSPVVMRCLNHSNIPRTLRKATIHKQVNFSKDQVIEENVTVGVNSKFVFAGSLIVDKEIIPLKVTGSSFFDLNSGKIKPSFLFGLEDLIGLQKRVHTKDMIGNQDLNYVTFLRETKGMVGNLNYKLDLFGEDRTIKDNLQYFLSGSGNLGENKVTINGRELEKDYYQIKEQYGPVEILTTVKVYD